MERNSYCALLCARVLCSLLVAQASKKIRFHPNMDAAMVERTGGPRGFFGFPVFGAPVNDMVGF